MEFLINQGMGTNVLFITKKKAKLGLKKGLKIYKITTSGMKRIKKI